MSTITTGWHDIILTLLPQLFLCMCFYVRDVTFLLCLHTLNIYELKQWKKSQGNTPHTHHDHTDMDGTGRLNRFTHQSLLLCRHVFNKKNQKTFFVGIFWLLHIRFNRGKKQLKFYNRKQDKIILALKWYLP